MSSHAYNRKALTKGGLAQMKEFYNVGRAAGYEIEKAKRYAAHAYERVNQGGHIPRTSSYTDWWGVNNTACTYDRLVLGKEIPRGVAPCVAEAMARMPAHRRAVVEQAAENIRNILGLGAEQTLPNHGFVWNGDAWECANLLNLGTDQMMACLLDKTRSGGAKAWARIKRGRDLFKTGLGGFDIRAGCNLYHATRLLWPRSSALPSPTHITVCGYLAKAGVAATMLDHNCWRLVEYMNANLEWTVQHWGWLTANVARLDELPCGGWIDYNGPPQDQLLIRLELREAGPNGGDCESETRSLRVYSSDLPNVAVPGLGLLKPVAGTAELVIIGKALHNCASSYDNQVSPGKLELVALWQDDKPKALAAFEWRGRAKLPRITQLRAACNKPVTEEVEAAFQEYRKQCRKV